MAKGSGGGGRGGGRFRVERSGSGNFISVSRGGSTADISRDGDRYFASFRPTRRSNLVRSSGMYSEKDAIRWAQNIINSYGE